MRYAPDTVQRRWASPLGPARLAATPRGLAGFWFDHQRHWPTALFEGPRACPEHPGAHAVLDAAEAQLADYFAGHLQRFTVPLELPDATPFQHQVWQALLALPLGHTSSYGALAAGIGRPTAVRAVGAAVGRNPVSIIVPCHRVLGSGGGLTGYAGGLDRKAALLALEAAHGAKDTL